ncbi:hypothetical protein LCM10_06770 [Rossellomorea aquimaris]|uniref:hypothetical protein n=1 Tax=Rossellomorea aquimaris TaxID=189382 RepID=UPI001CD59301|nr:hypothetical protein [Rossellomorea aquimaris]MCA1054685.1 hypothetical protein [Rossellomorea aquimaris]
MKNSEWNDREIEEMLKQMPAIGDDRDPSYIKRRAMKEKKTLSGTKRYVPVIVTIAAVFIAVLLSPAIVSQLSQSSNQESAMDVGDSSAGEAKLMEEQSTESSGTDLKDDMKSESKMDVAGKNEVERNEPRFERISLFAEDEGSKNYYSYGLITADAVPVPITVIEDNEREADWVERYEEISKQIPEKDWGFDEYFPIDGDLVLSENKKNVILTLDKDHPYSGSSAIESTFYQSLLYSFENKGVEEIQLRYEDGSIPEFSHFGKLSSIPLNSKLRQSFYVYSRDGHERYLVPAPISRKSVIHSMKAMKEVPSSLYQSVIPENVTFEVSEAGDKVIVTFAEELDLETMNSRSAQELVEGILLTAKSSGYEKVELRHIKQSQWNGFNFSKPLATPISPNKKRLE